MELCLRYVFQPGEERLDPHMLFLLRTNEAMRLETFKWFWRAAYKVRPERLAAAGWIYRGPSDKTACPFCHGTVQGWTAEDDPLVMHRTFFNHCPKYGDGIVDHLPIMSVNQGTIIDPYSMNLVFKHYYESFNKRVNTFHSWSPQQRQTVQRLADSGFVSENCLDYCMCHFCGIRIKDWKPEDDEYEKHILASPNCEFAKAAIERVQQRGAEDLINDDDAVADEQLEVDRNRLMCKICLQKCVSTLFEPCFHLVTCIECSRSMTQCPICRGQINRKKRLSFL